MYARLTTYRYAVGDQSAVDAADPEATGQEVLRLLTDQEGCRGAWMCAPQDSQTETVFFSLWDTQEQAEAAGDRARPGMLAVLERSQTQLTAPPEARVLVVEAAADRTGAAT